MVKTHHAYSDDPFISVFNPPLPELLHKLLFVQEFHMHLDQTSKGSPRQNQIKFGLISLCILLKKIRLIGSYAERSPIILPTNMGTNFKDATILIKRLQRVWDIYHSLHREQPERWRSLGKKK